MAYFRDVFCQECHQTKEMSVGSGQFPTMCHECEEKVAEEKVQAHLAEMRKLTTEERIERLERWAFTYKPPISIYDMTF